MTKIKNPLEGKRYKCSACDNRSDGWKFIAGKKTLDRRKRGGAHEWKGKCPKCGHENFGSDLIVNSTY